MDMIMKSIWLYKRVLEGAKRQKDAFLSMHCHRRNAKIKTFGGGHGLVGPPLDPPVGLASVLLLMWLLWYKVRIGSGDRR